MLNEDRNTIEAFSMNLADMLDQSINERTGIVNTTSEWQQIQVRSEEIYISSIAFGINFSKVVETKKQINDSRLH